MQVLVTGAAGFLGRHVAKFFGNSGEQVRTFDLIDVDLPDVDHVTGDLTDAAAVSAAVGGCDVVVHIGAIGDVYLAGEQPALAAAVNGVGTANVLDAAVEHGARVVYASTWEVYGEPRFQPITEDHPTMPDHPYNITKLVGESLVLSAAELRGLSAMALRLGTAYGSGLRPNSVFRIFIDRARRGEPITVQGDGSQGRQFTHASDIARAFFLAAASDVSGEALNIVAPESTSIKRLAEAVVDRFPTELTFGPARPGDVPPAMVSADRAAEVLGWRAEMPFEQGLDELIAGTDGDG
jgi:UDP-glucose 4-epimerase